ncbi:hypothetical protein E1212_23650 [Jiangella ureilytica]|uniref:Uncharacterized protein n=1 Tax=Jiangella ureilytica TaxID=2530374 RepID=A0A4R4REQ8_9ACTN|nr:hypothetical protein [Jiangella ureilytica]TDC47684.1 hypothetical protein E1212_23650 [Jiangella ureilytica]
MVNIYRGRARSWFVALSKAGASGIYILGLLGPHPRSIDLESSRPDSARVGDDYVPLTRTGHHHPPLKDLDGTEELLEELKRRDRVSSFGPAKLMGGIRVYMRHQRRRTLQVAPRCWSCAVQPIVAAGRRRLR